MKVPLGYDFTVLSLKPKLLINHMSTSSIRAPFIVMLIMRSSGLVMHGEVLACQAVTYTVQPLFARDQWLLLLLHEAFLSCSGERFVIMFSYLLFIQDQLAE